MRRFGLDLLRQKLDGKLQQVHKARRACLWDVVAGLLLGGRLWLTALGRSLPHETSQKHRIKAVDRLLGNAHLHQEMGLIYAALARLVLARCKRPFLVVDWTEHGKLSVLSAGVLHGTRTLPIYSEAHRRKKLGNERVQSRFLANLARLLPVGTEPIITTDAGFQRPWFDAVEARGWFYVGRIRNKTMFLDKGGWRPTKALYRLANGKPKSLGVFQLRREDPAPVRLVIFKKKLKGRVNRNRRGEQSSRTEVRKCARRNREPWLLAVSPSLRMTARELVNLYGARFQIEQTFRDKKNARFGWAAQQSRCKTAQRLAVLYLVATLARLACELLGLAAEKRGLHRQFQANTERARRVLSRFSLARLLITERRAPVIENAELVVALREIQSNIADPPIVWV